MRKAWPVAAVALTVPFLGLLSACGDDDDAGDAGSVDVTLSDFEIELSQASAPAGEVTFEVENDGPSIHEFVVFATDLAPDALPTDDAGDVAEGEDFEPVDEIEDIEVGASPSLTLDLDAGSYVLICNIAAHYRQGMRTAFTVE